MNVYSSVTLNGVGEIEAVYSFEYPTKRNDLRRVMLINKNNELHTWNEVLIGTTWFHRHPVYGYITSGEMVAANA